MLNNPTGAPFGAAHFISPPPSSPFNWSFSFKALRISFCVRLSSSAMAAISFEAIVSMTAVRHLALVSATVSGSGRKGLDFRPPQIDFPLFPSVGVSFSKTTSECVQMPRLIEDHRETRIGAGCRLDNLVQIGKCYPQPMLRHRRTGRRVQPYLKISSAGAGGNGRASSDRSRRGDRRTGGHHFGCGSRREGAWQPSWPKRDFFRQIASLKKMAKGEG